MRLNYLRYFSIILVLITVSTAIFSSPPVFAAQSGNQPLKYNQSTIDAIDREILSNSNNARYLSILKGLRWSVVFFDNDENFDSTFYNYLIMLDELTLHKPDSKIARIVHDLILRELDRTLLRLSRLIAPDADGYDEFIAILPVIYHHKVSIEPYKKFAEDFFARVEYPDRLKIFRRLAKKRDYDRLVSEVCDAASLDMAYIWKADRDFRLPPNILDTIMKEAVNMPLLAKYTDRGNRYSRQSYLVTHFMLALNHYGQRPYQPSVFGDRLFLYMLREYKTVRYRLGDLDILCEFIYCLRQFGLTNAEFIDEGERYVMSLQRPDGGWGDLNDPDVRPYHRFHPTWTAITMLILGI